MKKKSALNAVDHTVLRNFKNKFEDGLKELERARQFKLGDYLVLYTDPNYDRWNTNNTQQNMQLKTNSYGAPLKYLVVYVSEHGVPFVKQVNKAGNPIGNLFCCLGNLDTDSFKLFGQKHEFHLDPDYVDSMLLQSEYDPSQLHKTKHEGWKEITEHNKKCKIKTSNLYEIENFLISKVNVGDVLWRSNVTHWVVQEKLSLSKNEAEKLTKNCSDIRKKLVTVLTIKDNKGRIKHVDSYSLLYVALYTERPKSYKELNT